MEGETDPRRRARHAFPNRRWTLSILATTAAGTALVIGVTTVRATTTSAAATASSTTPTPTTASSTTLAPATGESTTPPPATGGRTSPAPTTLRTGKVPDNVEQAVYALATKKSYRDVYGGMIMISNQTRIAIYLTSPTPGIERAFDRLAPAGMLVFRKTPHSLRQLGTVQATLRKQWDALDKQGINLNEFGPNMRLGKEDIGVVNLTPSQTAKLDSMFGADMIHVYNITPKQASARQAISRG